MIDTHTHLYEPEFENDFEEVVARSVEAGVDRFIFPGIDSSCYQRLIGRTAQLEGKAFPAIGLHPTSVNEGWRKELDFVEAHLDDYGFVAIGEIGLDGYWSREFMSQQKEAFRIQMEWAAEKDLPVIIHLREATDDAFDVMDSLKNRGVHMKGVFHAFSGSYETYLRILNYGSFKVGIGGVVTYKNAGIAKALEQIPLSDIVLETDSPYLTPVPFRGKRNESSYIPIIADKVAQIKGVSADEVAAATTSNSEKLFNIK